MRRTARLRRRLVQTALWTLLGVAACGGAGEPAPAAGGPPVDLSVVTEATAAADARLRQVDIEILGDRLTTLRDETVVPGDQTHFWTQCLEEGLMNGCESLGDAYATGIGVTPDADLAELFYRYTRLLAETYCDAGPDTVHGCSQLGRMHYTGIGVPVDVGRGLELLRRGCAGGDDLACIYLEGIP